MKLFLLKLLIFLICIISIDRLLGVCFDYSYAHATDGWIQRENYISDEMTSELLFLGSSRAIHHYVPQLFSDSLGIPCFNCGLDGNGIIYAYGKMQTVFERYCPKTILYDVLSGFDLEQNDNHKYLKSLGPYYYRAGVDSVFWSVDALERYKMLSKTYQYNSRLLNIVQDNLSRNPLSEDNGYIPLEGEMNYEPEVNQDIYDENKLDSLKLRYIEALIKETRGKSRLIFLISPMYKKVNSVAYAPIKDICRKYNLPLLDHYCDSAFVFTKEYFKDSGHLNDKGAKVYSSLIAHEVKMILKVK